MTSIRRVWQEFQQVSAQLWGSIALSSLATISSIGLLGTSGWLIARASQMPPILDLTLAIVAVRTFALLRSVARYAERLVSHNATFKTLSSLRAALYKQLESLAPSGLSIFRRGDLMSRLVADVDQLQDLSLRCYIPALSSIIAALSTMTAACIIYLPTGLILSCCLLVSATIFPIMAMKWASSSENAVASLRGGFTEDLIDFFDGQADLLMLDSSDVAINKLLATDCNLSQTAQRFALSSGVVNSLNSALQGIAVLSSSWIAILAVTQQKLDAVMLIVIGLLPLAAFEATVSLPSAAMTLSRVHGSAERICEILDASASVDESITTLENPPTSFDVSLCDIDAVWPGAQTPALKSITFDLPYGTTLGLAGESGCGKSTLAAVLAKFLLPSTGTYSISGIDTQEITGEQVRNIVTLSGQDSHIFSTSLRENLIFALPRDTPSSTEFADFPTSREHLVDADLIQALKQAGLESWYQQLPAGLETIIGDRGATLSGGQRQRLSLARMFLANAHVWVLDEPTEHLDSHLASLVMTNVINATQSSSLIVASHRMLDTTELQRIALMDNGIISEILSPAELEASNKHYARQLNNERISADKIQSTSYMA